MTNPSPTLARIQAEHPNYCWTCASAEEAFRCGGNHSDRFPQIAIFKSAVTALSRQEQRKKERE